MSALERTATGAYLALLHASLRVEDADRPYCALAALPVLLLVGLALYRRWLRCHERSARRLVRRFKRLLRLHKPMVPSSL